MTTPKPVSWPERFCPSVVQSTGKPDKAAFEKVDHLVIALPAEPRSGAWTAIPEGSRLRDLHRKRRPAGPFGTRLHNARNTGLSCSLLAGSAGGDRLPSRFKLLEFAGGLAAAALRDRPTTVGVLVTGFGHEETREIVIAIVLALSAHAFRMPDFATTRDKQRAPELGRIRVIGLGERLELGRAVAEAAATNRVRWLTSLPPNRLDAKSYRRLLETLARESGWQADWYSERKLRALDAGAFLAVAQGNPTRDAGIMRLRYRPPGVGRRQRPAVALVGKGIIFDTGGTNLKPFTAMLNMHQDMAGSAVAVATLKALSETGYPEPLDCWLAITENRIGSTAYKSRDIVVASNGLTIEVIHTDAEGRMALADTLALAGRDRPRAIVDFATLTGSCVTALTERYSGVFSNREALHAAAIRAGKRSGERVWPFPTDDDFDSELKSEVADVLQCAPSGGGDHIQAARFLQRFVPDDANWLHVDLSAATRKGGLAQVPGEVTGFGARFAIEFLLGEADALRADDANAAA